MILHIVNQDGALLHDCQRALQPGDTVLLIENAVYAVRSDPGRLATLIAQGCAVCALEPDLAARGLLSFVRESCGDGADLSGLQLIDYDGFVDLTVATQRCTSWY